LLELGRLYFRIIYTGDLGRGHFSDSVRQVVRFALKEICFLYSLPLALKDTTEISLFYASSSCSTLCSCLLWGFRCTFLCLYLPACSCKVLAVLVLGCVLATNVLHQSLGLSL
jgi:hypothetical protein